ncbi:vertebrate ancient opsin-like protein [Labeo rohita]|uniref:Vertebrate ancient opsin-like protein n=1 Tax=Labeo rohita TaxID=84645 RepID=A0A498MRK2_LABRO|nr:vertebrate ancient long opsin a [Labeo rohita]RXN04560.1 vertebrate ancient opsin-like protein [Labeo rohita]RXN24228.1 vertebrate ancient opsin-like protein [Labeo rohita]
MESFEVAVNGVSHTEDPFSGPLTSIAPWNYKVLAALMFIVTAVSLCENFVVMLVTFRFKQLRQPLNYIIVNLSLADFLVSLTGGMISFVTNYHGYFFLGRWACVLEGFAVTFFGIVALWSLAVLAFERFFVICRPLGNIRLRGKHAALGLLFVWTFSFIWTIPPVLGWSSYTVSKIGTTCEPNWYSGNFHDHTFIITFFITCFIFPLGVIIVCYCKLLRKLRKVSNTQGRLGNARKPERQVTRMVVVMIVAFMVAWTPYAAFSIVVTACPSMYLDPRLAAAPAFFSKTAAVYNPIIYVFMNKQFRKCVVQLLSCSDVTVIEGNINQTTERAGMTNESNTGEMSAIAARIPAAGTVPPKTVEHPNERSSFAQIPIPENKVCPM